MLYLMMDKNRSYNLVKVGRSSDLNSRRNSYRSSNPFAIMRSTCAGTSNAELTAHGLLSKVGTRVPRTEWFIVSDDIFEELYEKGMFYFFPKNKIYFQETFEEIELTNCIGCGIIKAR